VGRRQRCQRGSPDGGVREHGLHIQLMHARSSLFRGVGHRPVGRGAVRSVGGGLVVGPTLQGVVVRIVACRSGEDVLYLCALIGVLERRGRRHTRTGTGEDAPDRRMSGGPSDDAARHSTRGRSGDSAAGRHTSRGPCRRQRCSRSDSRSRSSAGGSSRQTNSRPRDHTVGRHSSAGADGTSGVARRPSTERDSRCDSRARSRASGGRRQTTSRPSDHAVGLHSSGGADGTSGAARRPCCDRHVAGPTTNGAEMKGGGEVGKCAKLGEGRRREETEPLRSEVPVLLNSSSAQHRPRERQVPPSVLPE